MARGPSEILRPERCAVPNRWDVWFGRSRLSGTDRMMAIIPMVMPCLAVSAQGLAIATDVGGGVRWERGGVLRILEEVPPMGALVLERDARLTLIMLRSCFFRDRADCVFPRVERWKAGCLAGRHPGTPSHGNSAPARQEGEDGCGSRKTGCRCRKRTSSSQ